VRHHQLDLGLAPVGGCRQQLVNVVWSEMGREQARPSQVEPAIGHRSEQGGEVPRRPRHLDPFVRRILRQPQFLNAILVHRRIPGRNKELADIDLGNVSDKLDGGGAFLGGKLGESTEKIPIR
jgi:hypothetical protein